MIMCLWVSNFFFGFHKNACFEFQKKENIFFFLTHDYGRLVYKWQSIFRNVVLHKSRHRQSNSTNLFLNCP
jgi:hypothetical protein